MAASDHAASGLLRSALVMHHLRIPSDAGSVAGAALGPESLPIFQERFRSLAASGRHRRALELARSGLDQTTVTELTSLVSEAELAAAVGAKFVDVPGKAATARLAGKEELARLLTHGELLDLALPLDDSRAGHSLRAAWRRWWLEESLAAFPGPEEAGAQERTQAVAQVLAAWAEISRPPRDAGVGEQLGLNVARFVSTRDLLGPQGQAAGQAAPAGDEVTAEEVGRVAGRILARRALADLDVDSLRALAFGFHEEQPAEAGSSTEDEGSSDEWTEQSFLAPWLLPLPRLAETALAPLPVHDDRSPEDRRRKKLGEWPSGWRERAILAARAVHEDTDVLSAVAREILIDRVVGADPERTPTASERENIVNGFATNDPRRLAADELARVAAARLWSPEGAALDDFVTKLMFGVHGCLEQAHLKEARRDFTAETMTPKLIFTGLLAAVILLFCWLTVDVNLTSVHGLYRDRLASAFLVGRDTKGDVEIEQDVDLHEICRYESGSTAPYHLINVTLNLQASRDPGIRGRQSDFFMFSRHFYGGERTGYARSEVLEECFPQADLATAMAISAAAASPNMGRITSPFLVAIMTLLNVRLGYWMPHPGKLEEQRWHARAKRKDSPTQEPPPRFTFQEVFAKEAQGLELRWAQLGERGAARKLTGDCGRREPSTAHGLVGLGLSGGGIRSAAFNLGITQELHRRGVFDHVDYLSTVSGGGYLGSSLTTLMRTRETTRSEIAGTVSIATGARQVVTVRPTHAGDSERTYSFSRAARLAVREGETVAAKQLLLEPPAGWGRSESAGRVSLVDGGHVQVEATPGGGCRDYHFSRFDSVVVEPGQKVEAGEPLVKRHDTVGGRFRWRVRPSAFYRELVGALDETNLWVNLSDGGHLENLGGMELLRRRCRFVVLGDAEADPHLHFGGLATLLRTAQLDLGIRIEMNMAPLRLRAAGTASEDATVSGQHWVAGRIIYPPADGRGEPEQGYLLYLKASLCGQESEIIREYRQRNPTFPHQSTADQFFDEDQFEAYRALGEHVALQALGGTRAEGQLSFAELEEWFDRLLQPPKGGGAAA